MRVLNDQELRQVSGGQEDVVVVTGTAPSGMSYQEYMAIQAFFDNQVRLSDAYMGGGGGGGDAADDPQTDDEALEDPDNQETLADDAANAVQAGLEQGIEDGKFTRDDFIKLGDKFFKVGDVLDSLKAGNLALTAGQVGLDLMQAYADNDPAAAINAIGNALAVAGVTFAATVATGNPFVGAAAGTAVGYALDNNGGVIGLATMTFDAYTQAVDDTTNWVLNTPDANGWTFGDILADPSTWDDLFGVPYR